MTLGDLIERLQDLAEEHGEHVEVRLAHQPSWPLEYSVGEVAATDTEEAEEVPIVYIGEGGQLGYLSGDASRALGWR